ncbi:MAG TPA: molybdopterin guanine dinucleotide-containing S/N-oxide reductase [Pseudolabrys sp.]|nr:molybdopterin guanine dinucleotide-containing S/N-oxide reductase [Pseudolabrys sp.]
MTSSSATSRTVHTASHWGSYDVEVADGRIAQIRPFAKDTSPSPLIQSMADVAYAPNRVASPMVRAGWLKDRTKSDRSRRGVDPFVAVSWDEAIALVADELARVKRDHGNASIFGGSYGWASAGRFHHARTQLQRLLDAYGGCTRQVQNYSYGAGMTLLLHIVGSLDAVDGPLTTYDSIVGNTELLVLFGGMPLKNVQIESGGIGNHATETWLRRIKDAGIKVVMISPIREDLPDFCDVEWLRARPNTDAAIMLGLAHTLLAEKLHDQTFLDRYTVGFERFRAYLTGEADGVAKDAQWAAQISGLNAETIRTLARTMARKRTMIAPSWSVQRCDHGEQPFWMAIVLAAMLGQVGLPGGGFGFGYGSTAAMGYPRRTMPVPRLRPSPAATSSYIPVARLSDMLMHPGEPYDFNGERRHYPDIRLIYWAGGNPFHHHQDLNRLLEAWRRPETIVVHETWWTSTARFADIVLPTATTLERNDIGACSRDRFILAMQKAIDPVGEAKSDFDILTQLSDRLGVREAFTEGRDEMGWLQHIYARAKQGAAEHGVELPTFEAFWREGHVEIAAPDAPFDMLGAFRADPAANPLKTPSGKIEIFSERIASFGYDDCPGHPAWLEPVEWLGSPIAENYPLHMISNQPRTRLHSQLDGGRVSKASKINGREPMWINPADAEKRGIVHHDVVRVFNLRGSCLAGAVITDKIRPGVIMLSTGAWYDPLEPGRIGTLDRHGNANVLTIDKGSSKLAQATIAQSCLVEVERYLGELPPITVDAPPRIVERSR